MAVKYLIDTNVIVYAHDRSEPGKQQKAFEVMERLYTLGSAALTTQILAEFFTIVTRKLSNPLTIEESTRQVELLARVWPVFDVTIFTVIEAIRGVQAHQINYWDSQIWASALLNQIPIILSEDFSSGRVIEGVRFINPFIQDIE